jgi:Uma2 family endonuclease
MPSVTLQGITWETYKNLSDANESVMRLAYNQGCLEIDMSPYAAHETPNRLVEILLEIVTDCWEWNIVSGGSMTYAAESVEKGGEPDSCFYLRNLDQLPADITEIDPAIHAPDLVVEIDITSPSVNKEELYRTRQIPEIWRYRSGTFIVLTLQGEDYVASDSLSLPGMTATQLTELIALGRRRLRTEWRQMVRAWARTHRPA